MADSQDTPTPKTSGNQVGKYGSIAHQNAVGLSGYCTKHGEWSGDIVTACPKCVAALVDKVEKL